MPDEDSTEPTEPEPDPGRPLNKADLGKDSATALLGLMATKHLLIHGIATFYLSPDGRILIAAPGEVTLDALPEPMAVQTLQERGYTDEDLEAYLKGRDARMGRA